MSKLSKEKMNELKKLYHVNFSQMGKALGKNANSLSKLFTDERPNPQIDHLIELADYMGCTVDDFIEYDKGQIGFDKDKRITQISQWIYENDTLHRLLKYCKDLSKDELKALINVVTTFKEQPWIQ